MRRDATRARRCEDPPIADAPALAIRPVAPGEHVRAGELLVAAYRTLAEGPSAPYAATLRDVAGRSGSGDVLVGVLDDELVGCVTLVDAGSEMHQVDDPDAASIRMLAVDPRARGAGVGEALVRACLEEALRRGRRRMRLHTQRDMVAAQRLYARLGFTRDAATDWSPRPGVTLLGYVKELG